MNCELCGGHDRVTRDEDYTGKHLCYGCWLLFHKVHFQGQLEALHKIEDRMLEEARK